MAAGRDTHKGQKGVYYDYCQDFLTRRRFGIASPYGSNIDAGTWMLGVGYRF